MKRYMWLIALAMVTAIPAWSTAQGMPPADRQGGPGGPPPMGPRMGMRMGGPQLLLRPEVQKELKVTDEQRNQIMELLLPAGGPPPGGEGPGMGPGGPPPGGGPGEPAGMAKRRQEMDLKVKAILDAGQYARYQQLTLQMEGPRAFVRKDVATALALTDDQKSQIQAILQAGRPQPPAMGDGNGAPPPPPDMRNMEQRRKETLDKIVAILNADQQAKWTSMIGTPFKFERPVGRGMGAPMGGPGGPPPMGGPGGPPPGGPPPGE